MKDKLWRVKAYIEYEIEAPTEEDAVLRIGECIIKDLEDGTDIREIAEVNVESMSDGDSTR